LLTHDTNHDPDPTYSECGSASSPCFEVKTDLWVGGTTTVIDMFSGRTDIHPLSRDQRGVYYTMWYAPTAGVPEFKDKVYITWNENQGVTRIGMSFPTCWIEHWLNADTSSSRQGDPETDSMPPLNGVSGVMSMP
jgi:hypothetical protein